MIDDKLLKLTAPNLIACEGVDAKYFLIYYLEHLKKIDCMYNNFQVEDFGGNTELSKFIKILPLLPDFNHLKTLTIVRDSEPNSKKAIQSVQNTLKNCNFAVPDLCCQIMKPSDKNHNVHIGFTLFPSFTDDCSGSLEDLCLEIVTSSESKSLLKIVDKTIDSVNKVVFRLKRPHKNRLHTYLSLTTDFVGLKIG
ncbi:MAG: hypothetical protein LBP22_07395 [Deltaproteobacteria bacterium]|jgi:hypothetical protein|nr:hypothetical protein [Deltaproteobacteria bacterium]